MMNGGVDPQQSYPQPQYTQPQPQAAPQPQYAQPQPQYAEPQPQYTQPQQPAQSPIGDEETVQIRKRAIPGYSAEELAGQAQQAGDTPDVMKDDITEVTLFDYSDILNED